MDQTNFYGARAIGHATNMRSLKVVGRLLNRVISLLLIWWPRTMISNIYCSQRTVCFSHMVLILTAAVG